MAVNDNSIRQIVKRHLETEGWTYAGIAAELGAKHGTKQGFLKLKGHVGWYKTKMRKEWSIKAKGAEPVAVATGTALVPVTTDVDAEITAAPETTIETPIFSDAPRPVGFTLPVDDAPVVVVVEPVVTAKGKKNRAA